MKKTVVRRHDRVSSSQALALHGNIESLMREFKLDPSLLGGSIYADMHTNDVRLLDVVAQTKEQTVNKIAITLSAPITTISSALDRLERLGLLERKRILSNRRVVQIELTEQGQKLATRLREERIKNCIAMLARLAPDEREAFLRMMEQIATREGEHDAE